MKRGFWVSILLHILLLALPITITGVREFKEIELFVMEERPNPALFRPTVQEQRLLERSQTTISKSIEQKLIEKSNPLLMPPTVEEKKVENESVMEPQKYEVESRFEEKSEPIPRPPSASILEAERREKEAKELLKADIGVKSASKHTDSSQYWTVFGEEEGPRFLHQEKPMYPIKARRLGKEGKVVLTLLIDENGNLLNVEVLEKAGYGFTEAAVEAVRKSTFLPAKKDGKTIASRALLPIRFRLEEN